MFCFLVSLIPFRLIASTNALVGQQLRVLREIPVLADQQDYRAIGSIVAQGVRLAGLGSIAARADCPLCCCRRLLLGRCFLTLGRSGGFRLLILPLALIGMQSLVGRFRGSINLALVRKDVLWRLFIILLGAALFVTWGHPLEGGRMFR